MPAFYLIGDPALIAARARTIGSTLPIAEVDAGEAAARIQPSHCPSCRCGTVSATRPDSPTPANAPASSKSIDRAVDDVFAGRAAAVVTSPIAKKVLYDAGFGFPATPNISPSWPAAHRQDRHRR